MTRCRCAECGALLAIEVVVKYEQTFDQELEIVVHPCGACLQEARADALKTAEGTMQDGDICPLCGMEH